MTPQDFDRFIERFLAPLADYYAVKLSAVQQAAYFEDLADLEFSDGDLDRLRLAVRRTCEFMPRSAKIRDLIAGSPDDQALLAWAHLWSAASTVGGYESVQFEDAAIAVALERTFGSWVEFCDAELSPEMRASKRKEFTAHYRLASQSGLQPQQGYLIGRHELTNRPGLSTSSPPMLVGRDGSARRRPPATDAGVPELAEGPVGCVHPGVSARIVGMLKAVKEGTPRDT